MSDTPLDTIRRFVSGDMSPQEFRDRLYNNGDFETLLTNDPELSASNYAFKYGSTFHFLLAQNFDDPGGVLGAHGSLCEFMDRNHIKYSKTDEYSDLFNLILDSQPGWLDVSSDFVAGHMLPDADGRTGDALKKWLEAEFLKRFRFVDEPPEWIQSPDWPIGKNGPLVFLGQIELRDYFHDTAAAYVFHDPTIGVCQTIIQVY